MHHSRTISRSAASIAAGVMFAGTVYAQWQPTAQITLVS